jgi:hypothetical protein
MRHQYHRCSHLRLIRVDVSELSGARKGASVILEELCDARQYTPCVGLVECELLSLGEKQELLLASAQRLRKESGPSPLAGVSAERKRELEELRAELARERRRLVEERFASLGGLRLESDLARQAGPAWRLQAIHRALDAMDDEPYGFCIACGGLIELERLRLVPDTTVCVGCARGGAEAQRVPSAARG